MIHGVRAQTHPLTRPLEASRLAEPAVARRPRPERAAPAQQPASRASPSVPTASTPLRQVFVGLEQQRAQLDRAIRQAAGGHSYSPSELVALQARVYVYGESLEVLSHLVDRTVSAVKTTLNTQV